MFSKSYWKCLLSLGIQLAAVLGLQSHEEAWGQWSADVACDAIPCDAWVDDTGIDAVDPEEELPVAEFDPSIGSIPPPDSAPPELLNPGLGIGEQYGALTGSTFAINVIGDFLGGASAVSIVDRREFSSHVFGRVVAGSVGSSNSTLAFTLNPGNQSADLFTTGPGSDTVGTEGFADTFAVAEPLFPTDVPTSPGPNFVYDGGTAVYTETTSETTAQPGRYSGTDDIWFASYSFSSSTGDQPIVLAGPGVGARRLKIFEGFSPEMRHRVYLNYSFFNDAFGGLGDISRYVLGFERPYLNDLYSFELRVPVAGTQSSVQALSTAGQDRRFEFGNGLLIHKAMLLRRERVSWSAGFGVTLPFARDSRLTRGSDNLVVVENEAVNVIPFTGVLLHTRDNGTILQGGIQVDVNAHGSPVYGDARGGQNIPRIGTFNDSTLMYLDASLSQRVYRSKSRRPRCLSLAFATAELHYTTTLQDADIVSGNGVTYTSLGNSFSVLNATFGLQMLFGERIHVVSGMSVPMRDGLDEQFDYEALCQVNYLL